MKNHFYYLTFILALLFVLPACEKNNEIAPVYGTSGNYDDDLIRCEGTLITIDAPYSGSFGDLHLELAYDAHLAAFEGIIMNQGNVKLCNIKVAIAIKDGTIFLDTTEFEEGIDLLPSTSHIFELTDKKFNPTSFQPSVSTDGPCS